MGSAAREIAENGLRGALFREIIENWPRGARLPKIDAREIAEK